MLGLNPCCWDRTQGFAEIEPRMLGLNPDARTETRMLILKPRIPKMLDFYLGLNLRIPRMPAVEPRMLGLNQRMLGLNPGCCGRIQGYLSPPPPHFYLMNNVDQIPQEYLFSKAPSVTFFIFKNVSNSKMN
jgi:hypothetical protein